MRKKFWLTGGAVLVALVVMAWVFIGAAQQVQVAAVEEESISKTLTETGYVQTAEDIEIQARQNARIADIKVKPGDKVEKGQIILTLESRDLELEIAQAEAQLSMAEGELSIARQSIASLQIELDDASKNLDRQKQLHQAGAISQADYEKAESSARSLQEQLTQQQNYIGSLQTKISAYQDIVIKMNDKAAELSISSPIEGIILDLPLKADAYIMPGTVIAQVGAPAKMEVKVDLLSDDVKDVIQGQTAFISAPVLGDKIIEGKVQEIRPRAFTKISALGVEQRRVPVIISLNESANLKPGYEVQAAIETARKDGVLVLPREAVRNTGNGSYEVMKAQDSKIKPIKITVGLKNEDKVEVLSGLQKGEKVVRDATLDLNPRSRFSWCD